HTRWKRHWSSDVCSSDLTSRGAASNPGPAEPSRPHPESAHDSAKRSAQQLGQLQPALLETLDLALDLPQLRRDLRQAHVVGLVVLGELVVQRGRLAFGLLHPAPDRAALLLCRVRPRTGEPPTRLGRRPGSALGGGARRCARTRSGTPGRDGARGTRAAGPRRSRALARTGGPQLQVLLHPTRHVTDGPVE